MLHLGDVSKDACREGCSEEKCIVLPKGGCLGTSARNVCHDAEELSPLVVHLNCCCPRSSQQLVSRIETTSICVDGSVLFETRELVPADFNTPDKEQDVLRGSLREEGYSA